MSLPQARETSTAYRQTDWSQYISCIRYRIAWLPGSSGFGAVFHPVVVVVLKLLVDHRLSDSHVVNFRAVGKPWEARVDYACFLQLLCSTNLTHPGRCSWMQSQWAHRKDEHWLDSFSVCVPWERETERERREEREREREREKERGERDRAREREREGEKEKERRERRERTPRTCHRFAPSCSFIFFARAKTNHLPANGLWQCTGATHTCATATIMAPSLRQTLHCGSHVRFLPPFFYDWLRTVRFQRPLVVSTRCRCFVVTFHFPVWSGHIVWRLSQKIMKPF